VRGRIQRENKRGEWQGRKSNEKRKKKERKKKRRERCGRGGAEAGSERVARARR
jgi:hypothetical protein